jgi:hypothetical protein
MVDVGPIQTRAQVELRAMESMLPTTHGLTADELGRVLEWLLARHAADHPGGPRVVVTVVERKTGEQS